MIDPHQKSEAAHHPGALPLRVRRLGRDETGAATTAILVAGMVIVLSLLFMLVLPLTRGADQASRSQSAADAAVLAGAKEINRIVLEGLAAGDLSALSGPWPSLGSAEAGNYASRNDASLVQYSFDAFSDEIRAVIRFNEPGVEGTPRIERPAVAEIGLALGRCSVTTDEIEPEPEPTPTPTPTPTEDPDDDEEPPPPPPPPPPPTYEHGLECPGGVSLTGFSTKRGLALAAHDRLAGLLEERLIR